MVLDPLDGEGEDAPLAVVGLERVVIVQDARWVVHGTRHMKSRENLAQRHCIGADHLNRVYCHLHMLPGPRWARAAGVAQATAVANAQALTFSGAH